MAQNIKTCEVCGNFDTISPCPICASQNRDSSIVCVVRDVADLWAMERVSLFKGKYHVLGGVLSAMEGIVPEDLNIDALEKRFISGEIKELILALPATIDGQITSHYLVSRFKESGIKITTLAQGIPMGAELEYLLNSSPLSRDIISTSTSNPIISRRQLFMVSLYFVESIFSLTFVGVEKVALLSVRAVSIRSPNQRSKEVLGIEVLFFNPSLRASEIYKTMKGS